MRLEMIHPRGVGRLFIVLVRRLKRLVRHSLARYRILGAGYTESSSGHPLGPARLRWRLTENAMNARQCRLGLASIIAVWTISSSVSAQTTEDRAIRDVQTAQANAWNRHDAAAYAALFTDDGEVINVVGWWWQGRAEIERKLTAAFAFVFRESTLSITDVTVRLLAPDIAVAHVRWTMSGARTPPGVPEPREGIQIQVLRKVEQRWLIVSFQNTASVPERPFPLGPVAPRQP